MINIKTLINLTNNKDIEILHFKIISINNLIRNTLLNKMIIIDPFINKTISIINKVTKIYKIMD